MRQAAASVLGYWAIVGPVFKEQRGPDAWRATTAEIRQLAASSRSGQNVAESINRVNGRLEGFRAAPLSDDETLRRAGQLDRFVRLVSIEYGRGVSDGKVTKDFEIQEAISFRDGAAAAYADLEPILLERDRLVSRRVKATLARPDGLHGDGELRPSRFGQAGKGVAR